MYLLQALRWLLTAVEVLLGGPILYLAIVSAAAIVAAKRRPPARASHLALAAGMTTTLPRFAVLIPAHNEEAVLGHLLDSLRVLDYPSDRYDVYVIADNCNDRTAELAQGWPHVRVFERQDSTLRGKGYALSWAFERLAAEGQSYEAYVVFDADSVVEPRYLSAMAHELVTGARALQGCNTVRNTTESPGTVLRWVALTLMNHVRPLGRNAIGASSTLTGNGMCLTRELMREHPWRAFGATEDHQHYLTLLEQGEVVRYVPEAVVRSEMPKTFGAMRTQDVRWGAGQQDRSTLRTGIHLIRMGARARDWVRVEAALEHMTPPLSVLVYACVCALVAAFVLWWPLGIAQAVALCVGLGCYIGSAFYLLRPPAAAYRALLYAPAFMAWKVWVYFILRRSKKHTREWVRTSRATTVS